MINDCPKPRCSEQMESGVLCFARTGKEFAEYFKVGHVCAHDNGLLQLLQAY